MPIGFVADVHIGNHRRHGGLERAGINRRCSQTLQALDLAADQCHRENARLVIAGDLFDTPKPSPQIIAQTQKILCSREWELSREPITLLGNHGHGATTVAGDHALGPLDVSGSPGTVIEQPSVIGIDPGCLVLVPYYPGPAVEWLPLALNRLSRLDQTPRILVLHLGIADDDTPHYMQGADDSIHIDQLFKLCAEHSIQWVVAGNWHVHQHWSREVVFKEHGGTVPVNVIQCGALVPTGWDNPGLEGYGSVIFIDPEANEGVGEWWREEIPGPRFLDWTMEDVERRLADATVDALADEDNWDIMYVRIKVSPEQQEEATEALSRLKQAFPIWGEVVVDRTKLEKKTRQAARAARRADTLDEAVAGYVKRMPLDEDVDRARVLERVRGCLASAG